MPDDPPDRRTRRLAVTTRAGAGQRGLDWLNFFVADVQTGFGPFIAVALAAQHWTGAAIGAALSVGAIASMASQIPAGWLVDVMPSRRLAAALGILALTASALLIGLLPSLAPVLAAEVLHGFASCMIAPAIAAISLAVAAPGRAGEQLGRNARWASIGNGLAAAAMGACGYYLSTPAVFLLAAALGVPALLALSTLAPVRRAAPPEPSALRAIPPWRLFLDRRLLVFAGCAALFQLANAAMLPLIGSAEAKRDAVAATPIIAACILVPQIVVAAFSPWVGRAAERHGRRHLLLLGVAALPVRALLLATLPSAGLIVPVQVLDGIGGATFGVLVPLIAADIAGGTGRFNLCMGAIGLAVGIGASASTSLAGWVADQWGEAAAFLALAGAGIAALLLVGLAMPETRATPPIAGG